MSNSPTSVQSIWQWRVEEATSRADTAILEALESAKGSWLSERLESDEGKVDEDEDEADASSEEGASSGEASYSRSQLRRLIDEGLVRADGQAIKANTKLRPGQLVEVSFPPPKPSEVLPEERELEILYDDEHLLVVNKPPGMSVHPSPAEMQGTLVNALLHHVQTGRIRALSGIGGVLRPGIVHRIDKDTSGALVITKTDEAHRNLSEVFSRHAIERRYWALCYGSPRASTSTIESTIGRNPADRKKMAMNVKDGRRAVTHLRRIEEYKEASDRNPFASLLELTLETGRTHQIRVHLTGIGHSILADPVYGVPSEKHTKWLALPAEVRAAVEAMPGQALHARVLGFAHPITGKQLRFEAEEPSGFRALHAALKRFG